MLKIKFVNNSATLDLRNSSFEKVILDPKDMLGILELRQIGFTALSMVSHSKT